MHPNWTLSVSLISSPCAGSRVRPGQPIYELFGRYSTELWRVKFNAQLPDLLLKRAFREDRTGESLILEATFYENLAASLPVVTPGYIGRHGDALLLEWIPDLLHFDFRTGPVRRHAELAIDGYAALHAKTWNKMGPHSWLPQLADQTLRQSFEADFDLGWLRNRKLLAGYCPDFVPIGDALAGLLAKTLEPLGEPRVLLHGDGHAENLPLTKQGSIVFLDWQAPRVGNPGFDIAVFTAMSYPVKDRRKVEEQLVRRHADLVGSNGINWPDPDTDYRRGLLRRAARIVEISARGGFSSLPWVFERCAQAAVDHNVIELIEA